jgi:pseudoazurin
MPATFIAEFAIAQTALAPAALSEANPTPAKGNYRDRQNQTPRRACRNAASVQYCPSRRVRNQNAQQGHHGRQSRDGFRAGFRQSGEGVKGMLPDGVDPFKGEVSKDFTLTLSKEGVYGIKCAPHYGMGMVALITAGAPVNLDAAKAVKQPGKAKPNFAALFEQLAAAQ